MGPNLRNRKCHIAITKCSRVWYIYNFRPFAVGESMAAQEGRIALANRKPRDNAYASDLGTRRFQTTHAQTTDAAALTPFATPLVFAVLI
ncbi:hypothetical protein EVAR_101158_1 [Eumeta japonica]|uniref:Uncharacterized protein n=1 Tax=Eumeta variegata TaxID=151549 RepID=A0A4C1TUC8_EUMVA|nr:hypothetical protein EVAR_101158_1 [Eumeta japonica]